MAVSAVLAPDHPQWEHWELILNFQGHLAQSSHLQTIPPPQTDISFNPFTFQPSLGTEKTGPGAGHTLLLTVPSNRTG